MASCQVQFWALETSFSFLAFSNISYMNLLVQLISRTFSPCQTETLCSLNNFSFPPTPAPDNHNCIFCFYELDYFTYLTNGSTQNLSLCNWLIVLSIMSLNFIHVVEYATFPSLLSLNSITFCVYCIFLFTQLLMDVSIAFIS